MRARLLAIALLAAMAGCTSQPSQQPSGLRLTRTGFAGLPDWNGIAADAALASFQRSCAILMARPDAAPMGGAGYAGTVGEWHAVCAAASSYANKGDAKAFFERDFTPFAVGAPQNIGLFTGYYEPEIRASRTRHGAYQTPVYGLPPDLARADLGLFDPKLKGEHISGKLVGHALLPYADRAAIDTAGLDAPILFYTDDVIAFFFLQIQGSGRVLFDDGGTARIVYAGENGHAYTAIGRTLIADGSLAREDVSLQSIRAWLLANPARAAAVMETNRSYTFFAETPRGDVALGSRGFLGTSLTPLASLAVDSRIHALGTPFYVAADGPDPVRAVMVAQDIGGAIRGAVRGDIFFGSGAEAERRGGGMNAPGRLYLLLPTPLAAKLGAGRDYPP